MLDQTTSFFPLPDATDDDEQLLAQLLDEYLRALESGTPISLESLAERYPHLSQDLAKFGEGIDALHQATRHLSSGDASGISQADPPAKQLGDFLLGREIGRGGMGIVYEAHQLSLDRKVAIKVLPTAAVWDQKQVARFQNEARAAAQLQHPNIVPVFAVGEEHGVHFYAMQLIDGASLDASFESDRLRKAETRDGHATSTVRDVRAASPEASEPSLSTQDFNPIQEAARSSGAFSSQSQSRPGKQHFRDIARLGIEAADALQHAHDCGIIHRDVKPSNLLRDSDGKTWVADFGLARIQKSSNVTMTGDVVGTLRYMSPEQAAGRQAEVDARTDVYGLGTTLYELLTNQPPFPGDDRQELLHDITTRDPTPPRAINPAIPRDLETIVLHALEKSREDRYETAQALATDLSRFLAGRPPLARRPTLLDHTQRWLFRHRRAAALAVVVMAMLTLIFGGGLILLARETAAKNAALALSARNLERAEANLRTTREVVDRFGLQLSELLRAIPGAERLRRELLVETVNYYDGLARQAVDDPTMQDQVTDAHLKVASVTAAIGANREAIGAYRNAERLLEEQLAKAPTNDELRERLGIVHNNLALVLADASQLEEAERECERAIELYQALTATHEGDTDLTARTAEIQGNLSTILSKQGKILEARTAAEQAITTLTDLYGEAPADPAAAHRLALLMNNLSILQRHDSLSDAEQSARRAVNLLTGITEGKRVAIELVADLALAQANLAAISVQTGDATAARENLHSAITIQQSLADKAPDVARYRLDLINSFNSLALLESGQGDALAAEEAFKQAHFIYSRLVADYPNEFSYASGWAALLNNAGLVLARDARHEDADEVYRKAESIQEPVAAIFPEELPVKQTLSRIYFNHGQTLRALATWDEAIALASKRRGLWNDNGDQLTRVAREFLDIRSLAPAEFEGSLRTLVVETLHEALDAGYSPPSGLEDDEQFQLICDWPDSQTLKDRWTP